MRLRSDEDFKPEADESMEIDQEEGKKDVYAELKQRTEYYLDRGAKDDKTKAGGEDAEMDDADDHLKSDEREKVDQEELVRGFKYGSTYVPCPEGQFPRLSTRKGIDICGFFPDRNVSLFFAHFLSPRLTFARVGSARSWYG